MSAAGDAIFAHVEHLAPEYLTEENRELLQALCEAWGGLFDRARTVAVGTDTLRPGQALWDPAVAELWALVWNAQLSGAVIPGRYAGETDEQYLVRVRDAVINVSGWRRGTPAATKALARGRLTGTRTVTLVEHYQGSAWRVLVITYDAETPTPELTEQDLRDPEAVPAGVRLIYREDPGWNVGQLEAAYDGQTIADVEADYTTVGDLEAQIPNA